MRAFPKQYCHTLAAMDLGRLVVRDDNAEVVVALLQANPTSRVQVVLEAEDPDLAEELLAALSNEGRQNIKFSMNGGEDMVLTSLASSIIARMLNRGQLCELDLWRNASYAQVEMWQVLSAAASAHNLEKLTLPPYVTNCKSDANAAPLIESLVSTPGVGPMEIYLPLDTIPEADPPAVPMEDIIGFVKRVAGVATPPRRLKFSITRSIHESVMAAASTAAPAGWAVATEQAALWTQDVVLTSPGV